MQRDIDEIFECLKKHVQKRTLFYIDVPKEIRNKVSIRGNGLIKFGNNAFYRVIKCKSNNLFYVVTIHYGFLKIINRVGVSVYKNDNFGLSTNFNIDNIFENKNFEYAGKDFETHQWYFPKKIISFLMCFLFLLLMPITLILSGLNWCYEKWTDFMDNIFD